MQLLKEEAQRIVDQYIEEEKPTLTTQELLDAGRVPRLKGYRIQPGKVSDSIFGGYVSYKDKKTGELTEFVNPPLQTRAGVPLRFMVRTSRISTHDITRGEIPYKAQILAANHHAMLRLVRDVLGTSQFEVPGLEDTSLVVAAENLKQIRFENVLRAYMAKSSTSTSLYQHYIRGEKEFCGHQLPEGLVPNGPLPYVMDTPSTKSDEHDESMAPEELFELGVCTPEQYVEIRNNSLVAFGVVSEFLKQRGIIAVDTKTEHGVTSDGRIVSQDEIWTMDSSRFWLLDDYEDQLKQFRAGTLSELNPRSFSKEFARGFSRGEEGYTDDQRAKIAVRYIMGIQHLFGERFKPDVRPRDEHVAENLDKVVQELVA